MTNDELDAEIIRREQEQEGKAIDFIGHISPEFSDDSLALHFAAEYDRNFRYVAQQGKWYRWDGFRWLMDETLDARNAVRQLCRRESAKCNKPGAAKQVASRKTASAVEYMAQADRRLVATVEQWDADPWELNTPAGIVSLRTGEIRKHDRWAYMTKITGTAPDFQMPTPIWFAFLHAIAAGNTELIEFLQRFAGYSLTGSVEEHALVFAHGTGANGKTTFLQAQIKALGDYHTAAPIETFTASKSERHPTELAGLQGARFVSAVETEEGRRWAENKIKTLTGGEVISARFMRQDYFEFRPQFKLFLVGNHKPGLRSVDEAIKRRFNLVPFTVTIPPEQRDPDLPQKLEAELPGILAWMIRGCLDWRERGLSPPQVVTEATAEYLQSEDAIAAWIEECCTLDPSAKSASTALFASWSQWATKSGEFVGALKRFSGVLEDKGYAKYRDNVARGFIGIRINPYYRESQ
jgi:putative DNA primase/helicase